MTALATLNAISFSPTAIAYAAANNNIDLAGNLSVAKIKAAELVVALANLKTMLGGGDVNIPVINTTSDTLLMAFGWTNLADPSFSTLYPTLLSV